MLIQMDFMSVENFVHPCRIAENQKKLYVTSRICFARMEERAGRRLAQLGGPAAPGLALHLGPEALALSVGVRKPLPGSR